MSKAIIAAGHITDEAAQYLRSHSARIETAQGLNIIEIPDDADICNPGYQSVHNEYAIQWTYAEQDNEGITYTVEPNEWIVVNLELDASKTRVTLGKAR
jgi:hypothetical protein